MTSFQDKTRLVELLAIAGFIIFGIYTNAKEVPILKETLGITVTKVAVLEQRMGDIKESLGRIENAIARGR